MPLSEPDDPVILTDRLFRAEAGRLVSVLTGIFGPARLQLAEDVVQEALVRALQTWPYYGTPKNPAAWLTQTAKNLALDYVRREQRFREKEPEISRTIENWQAEEVDGGPAFDNEIRDSRLRLMFACCHPVIPLEAQIALALKTLCGLSPKEIATAFLTTEAAIMKRLTRARQKIRELDIPFEIPTGAELAERLDGVRQALYLLFNEGYKASSGTSLVRLELCNEAIRLASLLADHPAGNQPTTLALVSLMFLNGARLPARTDDNGNILRLKEQDRSRWDRRMIERGLQYLDQSATGAELTEFHLQAGIAACHATAADYESTDWNQILAMYDRLIAMDDSPVAALNRAVAVAKVHGPERGIAAAEAISGRQRLDEYHLYHAVIGELAAEMERFAEAVKHLSRALELADVESEKIFLEKRLQECEARMRGRINLR